MPRSAPQRSRAPRPVERFAPSPTGPLHLGHAFSALTAAEAARASDGRFLLRFEDIDTGRCRPEYEAGIIEDLQWFGLDWERPPLRQSARLAAYADALDSLSARGLLYPCRCSRKDLAAALSAPQEGAPLHGPDGTVYPGTCRGAPRQASAPISVSVSDAAPVALRLDMRKAVAALGGRGVVSKLSFKEIGRGPGGECGRIALDPEFLIERCGDVVLARKDFRTSYHLSVVLDDAHQGVTHVTRGEDLFDATAIHRLLQALLGRPTPIYRHHRLIRDAAGRRLAKRDKDLSIAELRAAGESPARLRSRLASPAEI